MPIYKYKGDVYNIPDNLAAEFESRFGDATIDMWVGSDQYEIPISEKKDFLSVFSNASTERTIDGVALPKLDTSGPVFVDETVNSDFVNGKAKSQEKQSAAKEAKLEDIFQRPAVNPVHAANIRKDVLSQEVKREDDGPTMSGIHKQRFRDAQKAYGEKVMAGKPSTPLFQTTERGNAYAESIKQSLDAAKKNTAQATEEAKKQEAADVAAAKAKAVEMYGVERNWEQFLPKQQGEQGDQPITGAWEGFKQGTEQALAGLQYLAGETLASFTGSKREPAEMLAEIEQLKKYGTDDDAIVRMLERDAKVWDTMYSMDGEGIDTAIAAVSFLTDSGRKLWRKHNMYREMGFRDGQRPTLDKVVEYLQKEANVKNYADTQMEKAAKTMAEAKPTEGMAWFTSLVPQMIPTGIGIGATFVTKNPKVAKLTANLGMALLSGSSAGAAMYEAREAGASDAEVRASGLLAFGTEILTEKIPMDRYIGRLTKTMPGVPVDASAVTTMQKKAADVVNELERANQALGGRLFTTKNVKDYATDVLAEGGSEFAAEAVGTLIPMVYENPEDYPTLKEVIENGFEGFKAGMFMGSVLGGASKAVEHRQQRSRRKQQGYVDVTEIANEDGTTDVAEVLGTTEDGKVMVLRDGATETIEREQLGEVIRYGFDEFDSGHIIYNIEESRMVGESIKDAAAKADANNMLSIQEEKVRTMFGLEADADVAEAVGDPVAMVRKMMAEGKSDAEVQTILDYANAAAVVDGMVQRVRDDIDSRIAKSDAAIDMTATTEGRVVSASLKNGASVYVVSGHVERDDNGLIDTSKSDRSVIVYNADTGKREMVSPSEIAEIISDNDAAELKAAAATSIREEMATAAAGEIDGVLPMNAGDVYTLLDENGMEHQAQIVGPAEDGSIVVNLDGQQATMAAEEIQAQNKAYNMQRAQMVADAAEQVRRAENVYNAMDEVMVRNDEGNVVAATITDYNADEDAYTLQLSEGTIDGAAAPKMGRAKMDARVESVNGEYIGEAVVPTDAAPVAAIPTDEQGNKVYESAEPSAAWADILADSDGDVEIAQSAVESMLEDKRIALAEIENTKPESGASMAEKIAAQKAHKAAVEKAKADVAFWENVAQQKDVVEAKDNGIALSEEVDENGRQFVLNSKGEIIFGEIIGETGLTPAPILLSEGMITNPETNDGYGLVHIEARHGDQIRNAGYNSIVEFVEEVAQNYEVIREGKNREGHQTYMLQLTDKHNNTLMVELSGDGSYWTINTAGIFKTSYGRNRREVYNRHTTVKQSTETVEASQNTKQSGTVVDSSMNAPTTSTDKDTDISETPQSLNEKVAAAEAETDTNPTEGQSASADLDKRQNLAKFNVGDVVRDYYDHKLYRIKKHSTNGVSTIAELDAEGNEVRTTTMNAHNNSRYSIAEAPTISQDTDQVSDAAYSIAPAQYTTKKGKVLDMHLVKFTGELTKEQQRAAKELAKADKGWYDRGQGGFMMRSEESAKQLADTILGNEEAVSEAQPVSMTDIQALNNGDVLFTEPQQVEQTDSEEKSPVWQYSIHVDKETGRTTLRRDDVSGVYPIGDARWQHTAASPEEMLDILRNPLNGMQDVLEAVGVTLENKIKTRELDRKSKEQAPTAETNPSGNRLVTDERYAELRERMRKKLGGQMNIGIDPEILAIGTEMAVYHLEKGARKFTEYAKAMVADLGDVIRPYLKAFYNGARNLPEVESSEIATDMTSYDEVQTFDIANFDKPGIDAIATAETVTREAEVAQEVEVAQKRIKKVRKTKNDNKNSINSQQEQLNLFDNGREENTAADNSGTQLGRKELPNTEQVGAGVSVQDTARDSKRKRRNTGVRSSESGNGPRYDVNRDYSNEEIEKIVSSVTDIVESVPFVRPEDVIERGIQFREGDGAHTDDALSLESDPVSKVLGKPRGTRKQRREFAQRERQRMAERVERLAKKLHLDNVEVVTDASTLEGKKQRAKGFYTKSTGKITIVIPNHSSAFDVEQTLLHEAVAHYGLRQLFGEHFDTFLYNVFKNADETIRQRIVALAAKNDWDFRKATEEYLAMLAENTEFENTSASWWRQIKDFFLDMLHKIGFEDSRGVTLTDNELRYILWRSYENLADPGKYRSILGEVADVAKQYELGVGNYSDTNLNPIFAAESDDDLYRDSTTLREEYDLKVGRGEKPSGFFNRFKNGVERFIEGYQDSMRALKVMQELVSKATGKRVETHEDAYMAENRMSSMNKTQQEAYERDFLKPMQAEIKKLLKAGAEYDEIVEYLFAKHGLERNEVFARRNAEKQARKEFAEEMKTALRELDKDPLDPDKQDRVDELRDAIEQRSEGLYSGYVRDYSGLTALTGSDTDYTAMAEQIVADFEAGYETDALWDSINAATYKSLRTEYNAGLMSKETFDYVSSMFKHYIPLRGWNEEVAGEEYLYIDSGRPRITSKPKKATGRKSLADDPIATIAHMGGNAIVRANRNKMKQHFLNLALNHPTELLTVTEQWYVYNPNTGQWERSTPDIPIDATGDEVADIVRQHEADMKALGTQAKKEKGGEQIGMRVTKPQLKEHEVRVMQGGKEYVIYVNGDPRAAQALNGLTNPHVNEGTLNKIVRGFNNFIAKAFTSSNPVFILENLRRDIMWAGTAVAVKENGTYTKKYSVNVAEIYAKAMLPRLIKKWQDGKLDLTNQTERYFDEFMRNGGETGFTQLNTVNQYKKDIARFVRQAKGGPMSIASKANLFRYAQQGVEFLNRSAEDTSRFAVYMTSREMGRDVARSIYDAKGITVNFNKKGSGGAGAELFTGCYVFFNAAVQSLHNALSLWSNNKVKATGAMLSYGAMGMALPLLNMLVMSLCGDDDEAYWDLPEWTRRNNLVFYCPWSENGFFVWPLPHEIRPIYGMSEALFSLAMGKSSKEDTFVSIANSFSSLLPMDFTGNGGNLVVNLMPTAFQPIAQLMVNKDFFGKPIYRDSEFLENEPEHMKAYKSAAPLFVDMSEWLNEVTGGNDVRRGAISINPDAAEHLIGGYFGGAGKFVADTYKTISMVWDEDMRELRNMPIVNRAYVESNEERTAGSHVNKVYFDAMEEAEETNRLLKGYTKRASVVEYAEDLAALKQDKKRLAREELMREASGDERIISKALKEAELNEDKELIDTLSQQRRDLRNNVVKRIEEINAGK